MGLVEICSVDSDTDVDWVLNIKIGVFVIESGKSSCEFGYEG